MKVLVYRNILLYSLNTWMAFKLPNSNIYRVAYLEYLLSLRKYSSGSTLSDLTASSKKVVNSSDKSKSSYIVRLFFYANLRENCVFIRQEGLIVFQNFSLPKTFFISKDSKYFLLSLLYNLLQKFLCILYSLRSV